MNRKAILGTLITGILVGGAARIITKTKRDEKFRSKVQGKAHQFADIFKSKGDQLREEYFV